MPKLMAGLMASRFKKLNLRLNLRDSKSDKEWGNLLLFMEKMINFVAYNYSKYNNVK